MARVNMADKPKTEKVKYVANVGMNLGDLKGRRIEAGDILPDGVKPSTLKDLLDNGDIKEASE